MPSALTILYYNWSFKAFKSLFCLFCWLLFGLFVVS